MRAYEWEERTSEDLAHYLQGKLLEAEQMSSELPHPNNFNTAVCCHLLDIVCRSFGRFSPLVDRLKNEIFSAVYMDREKLEAYRFVLVG